MSNPLEWFRSLYEAMIAFFTWLVAYLANTFQPAAWVLWLVTLLPPTPPELLALWDTAGNFVYGSMSAILVFNLAFDLPALGIALGLWAVIETALLIVWVWRGILSIIPVV